MIYQNPTSNPNQLISPEPNANAVYIQIKYMNQYLIELRANNRKNQ